MNLDTIANAAYYEHCHPLFAQAFNFLKTADLANLPCDRYDILGDQLYAMIQEPDGKSPQDAKLEAHRKYIDLQFVVSGNETMGWAPLCGLGHALPFDDAKDFGLFSDKPQSWFDVRPGCFAIFFPEDAHAPNVGTGKHRKVVIKIAL